ncbi:MAG: alpha/beta hydrolase [Marinilabiliaceae bacterium]|jgi:pimeloyl-ACP methyl ester carboxylesterase|nr:alpha/beta hydrolase [Marinilabiliaceae bacterium]
MIKNNFSSIRERTISCSGLEINYIDEGSGPVLLFIHNGGGFWQIWINQILFFKDSFRTIALDLPGFGKSQEADTPYDLGFNSSIVIEFCKKLDINRLTIIGNCIGATIGIYLKKTFPEMIDRLILSNICPGERLIRNRLMKFLILRTSNKRFKEVLGKVMGYLATRTILRKRFPAILFGNKPDKSDPLFLKYEAKFKTSKQTRSRINLLFASGSYTLANIIKSGPDISKSLLIWGQCNKVAPLKREAEYHRHICGIEQINLIQGGGHLAVYERPDEVNNLILQNLKSDYEY